MAGTTTGTMALDSALVIMDEVGTTEYNTRAVTIINMLCDKLYPFSDTYPTVTVGIRPVCPHITSLSDVLAIDDVLAQSVLPYGIASQLSLTNDATQAVNFEALFQERFAEVKKQLSKGVVEIIDVYGLDGGVMA